MSFDFFNIKLNETKQLNSSFKKVFGINFTLSSQLYKLLGLNKKKKWQLNNLNLNQIKQLKAYFPDLTEFDSDLKRNIAIEKEKFLELKCYKKNRFLLNLPFMDNELEVMLEQDVNSKIKFKNNDYYINFAIRLSKTTKKWKRYYLKNKYYIKNFFWSNYNMIIKNLFSLFKFPKFNFIILKEFKKFKKFKIKLKNKVKNFLSIINNKSRFRKKIFYKNQKKQKIRILGKKKKFKKSFKKIKKIAKLKVFKKKKRGRLVNKRFLFKKIKTLILSKKKTRSLRFLPDNLPFLNMLKTVKNNSLKIDNLINTFGFIYLKSSGINTFITLTNSRGEV